jgi:hypothetical protein
LCYTWNDIDPVDHLYKEYLELLIDYIKTIYQVTIQHLVSLLQYSQIIYNLLWALLKPNSIVYTTCVGTGKLQYVKYNFSKKKEIPEKEKYYNLEYCYLDFDSKEYSKASIQVKIPKFYRIKNINSFPAFPFKYYRNINKVYSDLVQYSQRFLTLKGSYYRYCYSCAFFIKNKKPVCISVDSRILIDTLFFQEIRSNNSRLHIDQSALEQLFFCISSSSLQPYQVKTNSIEQGDLKDNDLLICCPTVSGFSLGNKL